LGFDSFWEKYSIRGCERKSGGGGDEGWSVERGSRWILFFSLSFQLFIVGTVVDAFPYDFYFSGIWGSSYLRVSVTRSLQYFSYSFLGVGRGTNAPPLSTVQF